MNSREKQDQINAIDDPLLDSLSTAVVLLDSNLNLMFANSAAEQLFTLSKLNLFGRNIATFFSNAENIEPLNEAMSSQQAYIQREAQLCLPNASQPVSVDFAVNPIISDAGHKQLLLEFLSLNSLQRINKEDSHTMANIAARALVRGMAHEIKNPLGGMRGAAQLLARELPNEQLQEYTAIIINEIDRLTHLVDRMLGPQKPLHLQSVNIHQILEHARLILQAENGNSLKIERDYDPSLPELKADIDQLIQVILNVLRNAAQALLENPEQAQSKIIIRTRVLRWRMIALKRYRLVCNVEIQDNGPGVDKELLNMLFYPMVTGRAQGTGLGLPIAQAIMRQHGGVIECESRPGCTVFRVLIPFVESLSLGNNNE